MRSERQQLIDSIIQRGRTAIAWFLLVIALVFVVLAHEWKPTQQSALLFAVGIGAAIGITRVWNLLDEAHELARLEDTRVAATGSYSEDPS